MCKVLHTADLHFSINTDKLVEVVSTTDFLLERAVIERPDVIILSCPEEADKEYKRQFPDGPQPIATFKIDPNDPHAAAKAVRGFLESSLKHGGM